jgi:hypothetical protein
MKKTWLVFWMVSALAGFKAADAQEEQLTLPPDFALGKMPAFSKWQILFSYDDDKPAAGAAAPAPKGVKAAPRARQVTVTRTDPLWHAIVVNTDGTTQECWGEANFLYFRPASGGQPFEFHSDSRVNFGGSSNFITNYAQGDFPDLAWISPKTYIGGQKGIFVFQESEDKRNKGDKGAMAWVAADTRYPISWKKGNETRVFHILTPPTDQITFPPDIAKMAQQARIIENINNFTPPPPPPPPPS